MIERNTQVILDWIERMTQKHGGTVREKGKSGSLDWGQALARECYGENWNKVVPENPTESDVIRAIEWEQGDVPEWVVDN